MYNLQAPTFFRIYNLKLGNKKYENLGNWKLMNRYYLCQSFRK